MALAAVAEYIFTFNPLYEYFIKNPYYERWIHYLPPLPMSTQFSPTALSTYLLGCLPFNLPLIRYQKFFWRLLGEIGMTLGIALLISISSRGALLGLLGITLIYFFYQKRHRIAVGLLGILIMLILISSWYIAGQDIFKHFMGPRLEGIVSPYRTDRYIMVKEIVKDYPLTGIGFQHFRLRFCEYFPSPSNCIQVLYEKRIADNMYFTVLAETGAISSSPVQ